MDTVSVGIVTYNCKDTVDNTIASLQKYTKGCHFSVYCFDNASTDGTAEMLENTEGVKLIKTGSNMGFGKAHNLILKEEIGKYHAVVNPDIVINDDVLSKAVEFMDNHPDIVMLVPEILNADRSIQILPRNNPTFKYMFLGRFVKNIREDYTKSPYKTDSEGVTELDLCTGCFFIMRGEVYKALNGFDERFYMYLEDADITRRAKKYGKTVEWNGISVTHLWQRASAKKIKYILIHINSGFKYLKKWRGKN